MVEKAGSRRRCRACGESYDYPVASSLATRLHCESCAEIPAPAQRALESLRRRLARLERELEALRRHFPSA